MARYLIGADIGTQGTKAAVYRPDGTCLADSFEPSVLLHPEEGSTTQDPERMLGSVLRTVRDAVQKAGIAPQDVAAIGLDAQMSGILGVAADGLASTPYDSWLDTRCTPYVQRMKQTAEDEIVRRTGGQVTVAHGAKILWWKHERPETYARTAAFVTPTAYVTMRLCGLDAQGAYIDDTHLHFTGFADNAARRWDAALLGEFAVSPDKLPRILRPTETVGTLTADMAQACGLCAGIPVAAGCGDSAASSLGAGITRPGMIYDVAGTASIFSCTLPSFSPDVKNKTMMMTRSAADGLWSALAYISGGGLCVKWLRDICGEDYRTLDAAAEKIAPGCGELLFLPHFTGRTCPHVPSLRGTWLGLTWETEKAALYRSVMEGIAYEYALYLQVLGDAGQAGAQAVYGVGGGSRSRIFDQIKADVLGLPYHPLSCGDTAAWGSAILGGVACGLIALPAAAPAPAAQPPVMPDERTCAVYRQKSAQYAAALRQQAAVYDAVQQPQEASPKATAG